MENRIILTCDSKKFPREIADDTTNSPVKFWLGNDLKIGVYLKSNGVWFDTSELASLTLGVKPCDGMGLPEETETFDILKSVATFSPTTNSNGADVIPVDGNALFEIGASDISAQMKAGLKWIVVQGEDSEGKLLTFTGGNILCMNDAADGYASAEHLQRIDYDSIAENVAAAASSASAAALAEGNSATSAYNAASSESNAASSEAAALLYKEAAESAANQAIQTAGVQELRTSKTNLPQIRFMGGGALACLGTPCAAVKSRAYLFIMSLDEDWDVSQSINDYNRRLNVIGDIMVSGGLYTGISFRIDMSGITYIVCGKTTSGEVNLSTSKKCGEIFGGSSDTVIPAGIYSVVVSVDVGETNSTGYIFVNGVLKDSRTLDTLTASNFNLNTGKSFAVGNSGNYNAFDFTKSALKSAISRVRVLNRAITADEAASYAEGREIATAATIVKLDEAISGAEIRDLSGNGNHFAVVGSVTADAVKNPANCNWTFSFASGATTSSGQYFFGRSDTNSFPAKCQATLLLRASGACSVNVGSGTSSNTSAYASGVSLAANAWTRVEICNDAATDAALTLSPAATLSAATTVEAILTINQNY